MKGSVCYQILQTGWEALSGEFPMCEVDFHLPAGPVQLRLSGLGKDRFDCFQHLFTGVTVHELRGFLWRRQGVQSPLPEAPQPDGTKFELQATCSRFVGIQRPGCCVWMDREERTMYGCLDPSSLLPTDRYKPLHGLWMAWHDDCATTVLHAALVCRGESGALLLGPPNSGKSTVVAACLQSGMKLVSDDYTALTGACTGAGFYAGLWLEPARAARLEDCFGPAVHHRQEPKSCLPLSTEHMRAKTEIRAILIPRKGVSGLRPCSTESAISALRESRLVGPDPGAEMEALARSASCFEIGLEGRDSCLAREVAIGLQGKLLP